MKLYAMIHFEKGKILEGFVIAPHLVFTLAFIRP